MPPLSYTKVQHIWVWLGALCSTAQAVYTPPNITNLHSSSYYEWNKRVSFSSCLISIQGLYSPHRMSWAVFFSLSRSVCVSNRDNLFLQSRNLPVIPSGSRCLPFVSTTLTATELSKFLNSSWVSLISYIFLILFHFICFKKYWHIVVDSTLLLTVGDGRREEPNPNDPSLFHPFTAKSTSRP